MNLSTLSDYFQQVNRDKHPTMPGIVLAEPQNCCVVTITPGYGSIRINPQIEKPGLGLKSPLRRMTQPDNQIGSTGIPNRDPQENAKHARVLLKLLAIAMIHDIHAAAVL